MATGPAHELKIADLLSEMAEDGLAPSEQADAEMRWFSVGFQLAGEEYAYSREEVRRELIAFLNGVVRASFEQ